MASIQTLTEEDRRLLAGWAGACAERAMPLFTAEEPAASQIQDALARTYAFAAGESTAAAEITLRMVAFKAAGAATTPAGAAAARAVAQAAGVAHMGAHALGAAGYVVKALTLGDPTDPDLADRELRWQLDQLKPEQRSALRQLPLLGEDSSGPLGPGLLASGVVGATIRAIQADLNG